MLSCGYSFWWLQLILSSIVKNENRLKLGSCSLNYVLKPALNVNDRH